jgi:hypothetical protein
MGGARRFLMKTYALKRMGLAVVRSVAARTPGEKEIAARWAAAWGCLCGIHSDLVRLKPGRLEGI